MKTIGFIGLGNMGAAMASNIRKAGYALVVHDVRADAAGRLAAAGARVAASPARPAGGPRAGGAIRQHASRGVSGLGPAGARVDAFCAGALE